ncbi:MAG: glutathione S-transferase C-terminal domain-containing protein, partial [Pseudomonadota bacterium]
AALTWFENHPESLEAPLNLAQITLGVALAYLDFRTPEEPWRTNNPNLARWYAEVEQRRSFKNTPPDRQE